MSRTNEQIFEWSKPPSRENDLSVKTYQIIKEKLEKNFWSEVDIFLQWSYSNSTNIKKDSDIDIVICYKKSYFFDISNLNKEQQDLFHSNTTNSTYSFSNFKKDVETYLISIYWKQVERKNKCIKISWNWYRVDADVVPCFKHNRYSTLDKISAEWIQLISDEGETIVSFPKQHKINWEKKNQQTNENYKWFVRVIKNCKKNLVDSREVDEKLVSSFLLECLVRNLPNMIFTKNNTYKECFNEIISSLYNDMWNKDKYNEYAEVCDLFYLLRWKRSKSTPLDIRKFLEQVYNLINS